MREIIIDEANFATAEEVHAFLAHELDFPSYYGANLDALNDCLSELTPPSAQAERLCFTIYVAQSEALVAAPEGQEGPSDSFAVWFPKLIRSFLRAARETQAFDVVVHAGSVADIERLLACKGMPELLAHDTFIVQAAFACLAPQESENEAYAAQE